MRKLLVGFIAAGALAVMVGPAQAQVPRHFHQLTTPNGETHTIAQGLTAKGSCQAFLNFHGFVHMEVFGTTSAGMNPLGPLGAQFVQPMVFCP